MYGFQGYVVIVIEYLQQGFSDSGSQSTQLSDFWDNSKII